MQGNVYSWCQERYKVYPQGQGEEPEEDKEDKEDIESINKEDSRVLRGGSFADRASYFVRSAGRVYNVPWNRASGFGFRLARTFTP
jgi:formylglycine-generating enzyme required for sulfatase activity